MSDVLMSPAELAEAMKSDKLVLIDTAGRYLTQPDAEVDGSGWHTLLSLLRQRRRNRTWSPDRRFGNPHHHHADRRTEEPRPEEGRCQPVHRWRRSYRRGYRTGLT